MFLLRLIDGNKTYSTAVFMGLVGLWFLLTAEKASWDNPDGAIETAVRNVVGWVLVSQGAAVASLRHAIGKL